MKNIYYEHYKKLKKEIGNEKDRRFFHVHGLEE